MAPEVKVNVAQYTAKKQKDKVFLIFLIHHHT